ncbi:MAG: leucine-rich repeat protein, partial [Planctomycetaceae bacterium]|nr:leucine-rich repeat protein [Planctomycetaceae bacterium]
PPMSGYFKGQIKQVRISRGARYLTDTIPLRYLTKDANTLALYRFDEGQGDLLKDSSGNGHHGRIVGAKWVGTRSVRGLAHVLEFDGNSEVKVEVPSLRLRRGGPLTLEAYFTPTVDRITNVNQLLGFQFNSLYINPESQNWQFVWQHGDMTSTLCQANPFVKGRRVHVAGVVVDGESRLFVDGKGTAPKPLKFDRQTGEQELAGLMFGVAFQGSIDNVRVSRTARYRADFMPADRLNSDAETLAYFDFAEGHGNELKDSSGNNHHGKIVGAKWVAATNDTDGSLRFTQMSDHVELPALPLKLEEPFVIEAWVQRGDGFDGSYWYLADFSPGPNLRFAPNNGRNWQFATDNHGSNSWVVVQEAGQHSTPQGTRQHVAGQWTGTEMQLFVDGVAATGPLVVDVKNQSPDASAFLKAQWKTLSSVSPRLGGSHLFSDTGNTPGGRIYSLRISNGLRYEARFAPQKLVADARTLALYEFEEGRGDVLKDSSGNNRHGKILGAKWVQADGGSVVTDPDRRAATYILSVGGTVQINEIPQDYTDVRELPKSKFRLTSIVNVHGKQVSAAGLAACRDCQHLTHLTLAPPGAIGDAGLEPFRQWKKLKVLNLGRTYASDAGLAYFNGCRDLTNLSLHEDSVTDLGLLNFKDCQKLESLELAHARVTEKGIAHFQDCQNLQTLTITNTSLGDAAFAQLKSFTKLKQLAFANTQVTNAGLASLPSLQNLTVLNLSGTQVDDGGVEQLKKLTKLTDLRLLQTKLTSAGIAELKKALPNCKIETDIAP